MKAIHLVIVLAIALVISACNVNQELPLTVVVYPAVKRCTVVLQEKEQEVKCVELGTHLRDTLKVSIDRQINVSLSGSDNVPKEDQSIDRVAELIRAAGFKDVRAIRLGL